MCNNDKGAEMFRKILIFLVAGLFILGTGKLSFAMMCDEGRHQKTAQVESAEYKHTESEVSSDVAEEAVNVGNKICPVSGEKIDEKMKTTYEYEGKIYNFCCPMCIDDFKKDPERYIKELEKEGVEENSIGEHSAGKEHHH